eukprot:tig00000042_g15610.t1
MTSNNGSGVLVGYYDWDQLEELQTESFFTIKTAAAVQSEGPEGSVRPDSNEPVPMTSRPDLSPARKLLKPIAKVLTSSKAPHSNSPCA